MRYLFNGVDGAEWYGIVSLLIFTLFFVGVSIWALRVDKKFTDKMKNLPLDDNTTLTKKEIQK